MNKHVVYNNIAEFISKAHGVHPDALSEQTRLEEDLGITGDDALAFIEKFSHKFNIDMTGFNLEAHFGPESWNPIWVFFPPRWLKNRAQYPVTVGHLMQVIADKRWSDPKQE